MIVRNVFVTGYKKKVRTEPPEFYEFVSTVNFEKRLIYSDQLKRVAAVMDTLPRRQREIVYLKSEGITNVKIAELLKMKQGEISRLLYYSREKIYNSC